MLNAGLTAEEIGQRLARTPVAICSRIQNLVKKPAASVLPPERRSR
jgi:hypothetical protein